MSKFNMRFSRAATIVFTVAIAGCASGGGLGLGMFKESLGNKGSLGNKYSMRTDQANPRQGLQASTVAGTVSENLGSSSRPVRQLTVSHHDINARPVDVSLVGHVSSASPIQPVSALVTLGANDDFDSLVSNAPGVVLVDFYADWCGPCRKQGGILHEMEPVARRNRALILKVNVDQHRELASRFQVSSLPTIVLMRGGQIIHRQSGLASEQQLAPLLVR